MIDTIVSNLPDSLKGKKLRILELGSGRGGMGRNICLELKKRDMLGQFVATNISTVENNFNVEAGKKQGLEEPEFLVRHISFDDLFTEGTITKDDKFDVITSIDSLLHSSNRTVLLENIHNLLNKDGLCFISDILVNSKAPEDQVAAAKARFSDSTLGSDKEYEDLFEKIGY